MAFCWSNATSLYAGLAKRTPPETVGEIRNPNVRRAAAPLRPHAALDFASRVRDRLCTGGRARSSRVPNPDCKGDRMPDGHHQGREFSGRLSNDGGGGCQFIKLVQMNGSPRIALLSCGGVCQVSQARRKAGYGIAKRRSAPPVHQQSARVCLCQRPDP